jgi:hypothetical protein
MDDARIRRLTEDVLAQLGPPGEPQVADLEARVAALEEAVRRLSAGASPHAAAAEPATTTVVVAQLTAGSHPSLASVGPKPSGDRCCLEPDKPCTGSGQCRAFGH